jgi:polyisoprenoid-binding protein YceI
MKYVIDVANSEVLWSGFLPATSISGRVFFRDGFVVTDEDDREITSGLMTIDMDSIETLDDKLSDDDKKKLTAHLKSEDFFDSVLYPAAEFKLLEVKALGERADSCNTDGVIAPSHEVVGELNLKGITHRVTALVNMQKENRKIRVQTMFTLDRTNWGIDHLIESENGSGRVLPDMEIIVRVVADALPETTTAA